MNNYKTTPLPPQNVNCVATVGLAVVDHVFQLDHMPAKAEKHFALSLDEVVGGIAANAALAVVGLGGRAKLFTRVGDDSAGRFVNSALEKSGVETDCVEMIQGHQTATSAVILDKDGERMIINYKPIELFTAPPEIEDLKSKNIGAVLADLRWQAGTTAIFRAAYQQGIPTVLDFDLAPDTVSDDIFNYTSHIIFAEAALKLFTKKTDLTVALRLVSKLYPNIQVAVTAGADGVLYVDKDDKVEFIKSRPVSVVSTLGAGDIFHGAATLSLMEGHTFEDALRFANDVAAVMISKPRTEKHLPTQSEVEELQRKFA